MTPDENLTNHKEYRVLVAVDFSACSAHALKSSQQILGQKPDRIFVLHVIDHEFIQKCLANRPLWESGLTRVQSMKTLKITVLLTLWST